MTEVYKLRILPTTADYVRGLAAIRPRINKRQMRLLIEHYRAPKHAVAATQLAELAGVKGGYSVVNSLYGRLGHMFCDEISFQPERRSNGTYRWWAVWSLGYYDSNRFIWQMLPEVAEALELLGWVTPEGSRLADEAVAARGLVEATLPTTMRHYIAYHKVDEYGNYRVGGRRFRHYSAHPRSKLEKTLGQTLWVISGERIDGHMVFKLCSVYRPKRIEDEGDAFSIVGSGLGFNPHIDVTTDAWLPVLLKEQGHFRYGLNQIKSRRVITGLLRTRKRGTAGRGLQLDRGELRTRTTRFGGGFGTPENNEAVERAAVDHVANEYRKNGWQVDSVELERCGFDLRCRKGKSAQDVEVKGIAGDTQAFIITSGEVKQAQVNDRFTVCVVTKATSDSPSVTKYTGSQFLERFALVPLQFRAVLRR